MVVVNLEYLRQELPETEDSLANGIGIRAESARSRIPARVQIDRIIRAGWGGIRIKYRR